MDKFELFEKYGFEFKGEVDMMVYSYVHENTVDVSIAIEMKPNHTFMHIWNTDQEGNYSYDEDPIYMAWETPEELEVILISLLRCLYKDPREYYSTVEYNKN